MASRRSRGQPSVVRRSITTETQSCEDGVLVSHRLQREWMVDQNMDFILLKICNHEDDDYNTEYQLYPEYAIKNAGKN